MIIFIVSVLIAYTISIHLDYSFKINFLTNEGYTIPTSVMPKLKK